MKQHREIRVTGHVQGVFFRKSTQAKAVSLHLTGTVENVRDGSVVIHAEGEPEALDVLEHWCHDGPPAAHVEAVTSQDLPLQGFEGFQIVPLG